MKVIRLLASLLVLSAAAAVAQNAHVSFEIRNEADVVVAQGSIATSDNVLQRLNDWRLDQKIADPANQGQVILKYPTSGALLKSVLVDFFKAILKQKPTTEIQAQLDAIEVAKQAIKNLEDAAVQ